MGELSNDDHQALFRFRTQFYNVLVKFQQDPRQIWANLTFSISVIIRLIVLWLGWRPPLEILPEDCSAKAEEGERERMGEITVAIAEFCSRFPRFGQFEITPDAVAVNDMAPAAARAICALIVQYTISEWLVPCCQLLLGILALEPSDGVIIAVTDACSQIVRANAEYLGALIEVELPIAIVAAVGDCLRERVNFACRLFDLLYLVAQANEEYARTVMAPLDPDMCCRCIVKSDITVAAFCLDFVLTKILQRDENFQTRFASTPSMAILRMCFDRACAKDRTRFSPPGCWAWGKLCCVLVLSGVPDAFQLVLEADLLHDIAAFGEAGVLLDIGRYHLLTLHCMIQRAIILDVEQDLLTDLSADENCTWAIDSIFECSDEVDVTLTATLLPDFCEAPVCAFADEIRRYFAPVEVSE
jgi:hypothetical protein